MTSWKELLKELNLTIKDFAELYEIPYNTVRQWYNGTRQAPPYIKKMIETIIELKSKGKQMNLWDEEFYGLRIYDGDKLDIIRTYRTEKERDEAYRKHKLMDKEEKLTIFKIKMLSTNY